MLSKLCVRATTKNTCEDSVFVKETESSVFGIVADGCSTGINSAWASQLLCYLFSNWKVNITSDTDIKIVVNSLIDIKNNLVLSEMNLLSTALLFHYDKESKVLLLRTLGDGYYVVNTDHYNVEHNNIPDYLTYHLYDIDSYLEKYPILVYEKVESFCICSDGILSFKLSQFNCSEKNPAILWEDPTSENYLKRMFNVLTKHHWIINDDLSIVSYANQSK